MIRRIKILQVSSLPDAASYLLDQEFEVLKLRDLKFDIRELPVQDIRGIVCTSQGPVDAALINSLPNLEIIACHSAGLEGIDLEAARERGVTVTNTSRVLAEDVADVALALLIAVARQFAKADRFVRTGAWNESDFPLGHSLGGVRVGIIGLGPIGSAVARRVVAIGASVGYFGRKAKPAAAYPFFSSINDIATWARALVISCPGGAATRHLINAPVLDRLGPEGWLVNISRGSIIDEVALIDALRLGKIAGAGLDVFENEPDVPAGLVDSDRVFLLPHLASATTETRMAMAHSVIQALKRHFGLE